MNEPITATEGFPIAPRQPGVAVKRLTATAKMPEYATGFAVGADLFADEDVHLAPGGRHAVSTGLSMEIPPALEGQVRSKSGLASKNGIVVLNSPGTIDPDYRGEIKVILINLSQDPYEVKKGQKIAQLVIAPRVTFNFAPLPFYETDAEFSKTERGTGGFGSTGV